MSTTDALAAVVAKSKERPIWLRIGQIIDGVSDRPLRDADIVFDARQIHFVGQKQGSPDLILPAHTLLPCLIEAHAHMFLDGAPVCLPDREQYLKESAEWMLARARARWPKIVRCGVGAIRDAGDKHGVGLALSAEAKKHRGELSTTPWIDSPGAAIHHRGRYGAFMGEPIEDHASPAACVAARVKQGADRIKLLVSGIINFKEGRVTTPPQMSIDEVKQLVQAAHEHGRQTFAHASGSPGVEHSIEGGVNTIEHGFFITEDQLKKMRDRNIGWVPTFAPVQAQIDNAAELNWSDEIVGHLKHIIAGHQEMLRRADEMGVTILAGSDAGSCGVPHGLGLLTEMQHMETAGMSAMNVIRSATGIAATTLDFPEKLGRLAVGCRSRLILTQHDPLASVANLQRQKTVVFDGEMLKVAEAESSEGL